jgi:hypothetical protein
MDRTRQAWARFGSDRAHDEESAGTVHFIPAVGGCFVVIQEQRQAGLLESLHLAGPNRSEQPDALLDEFCRWLDEHKASRPVRRIVT